MRRAVVVISTLLVAGIAVPAAADHIPVDETPDYNIVDGTPICGVEGEEYPPAGDLLGTVPSVGTYNILHSQGENADADVTDRQPQIITALIEGDVDAWGLQEVTNDAEHGNQAQELAAALSDHYGEPWEWCWSMSNPRFPGEPDLLPGGGGPLSELTAQFSKLPEGDLSGFKEGLAIVTRFHIAHSQFRRLQPRAHEALSCPIDPDPLALIDCQFPAVFDSRQVLHAAIVAGGTAFDLFNTHIAHSSSSLTHAGPTKKRQIEKVVATIGDWAASDGFHFLVGDLNSDFERAADRIQPVLDAGFIDTYGKSGATECRSNDEDPTEGCTTGVEELTPSPSQSPDDVDERIDYVFARSHRSGCPVLTVTGSRIIGTNAEFIPDLDQWRWPSDHFGVASDTACA